MLTGLHQSPLCCHPEILSIILLGKTTFLTCRWSPSEAPSCKSGFPTFSCAFTHFSGGMGGNLSNCFHQSYSEIPKLPPLLQLLVFLAQLRADLLISWFLPSCPLSSKPLPFTWLSRTSFGLYHFPYSFPGDPDLPLNSFDHTKLSNRAFADILFLNLSVGCLWTLK